jgi:phosphatidylserine/phosphatidylglycerophosphate/cardiolipin synthase-like enzyme
VLDGRRFGGEIAHGRLCIVDGRTAIVGSTGLASKSLDRGRELSIRLDEPAAVASLTTYFDAAFANLASADWRRVA